MRIWRIIILKRAALRIVFECGGDVIMGTLGLLWFFFVVNSMYCPLVIERPVKHHAIGQRMI